MKVNANHISFACFSLSTLFFAFLYGVAVGVFHIFPFQLIYSARHAFDTVTNRTEYYFPNEFDQAEQVFRSSTAFDGINLVTCVGPNRTLFAKVIDMEGTTLREWKVDWFELWDERVDHLPPGKVPQSPPGTHIHGAVVMDNGDLVFNFEELGHNCPAISRTVSTG